MEELLRMENITKRFGDMYANKNVQLVIEKGEVHTLLGENGAGKSTLMNVLIGLYQPTEGRILLRGKEIKIDSPKAAVSHGIGMVHQHFMLVDAMTVFENIILGNRKGNTAFIQKEKCRREILELAEKYDLDVELDKQISEISVGAQQRVEILKSLYRGADILILDEPTAVLTDPEVHGLFQIMRRLKEEGKSVIFISHKMREVMEISDKITILRAGESVKTVKKEETTGADLANLMIGCELVPKNYQKVHSQQEEILRISQVSYQKENKHNGLNGVSLSVRRGEVVGIAGVDGNGQSQLALVATGVLKPEEGEVVLRTEKIAHFIPEFFIRSQVSHIPEDRNKMGLVGGMTVAENLIMKDTSSREFSDWKGWHLKRKKIQEFAQRIKEDNDIRCTSIEQEVRNLSGGNQQKIILARELARKPELLVAVHPTRGLDVGATDFVHSTMIGERDNGCAVLLISADFDEILKLSDRIVVMFEGQVMGVYPGENPPVDEISLAMAGK